MVVNRDEGSSLKARQLAFLTLFEFIHLFFFANRLYITISGNNHFQMWAIHTAAMCSFGFYAFLIFGVKRQNFQLWRDHLTSFCRSKDYEPM